MVFSLPKTIAKDISKHSLRNLAIFRVAYRCALKASEVGLIHLEDYKIGQGVKCIAIGLKEAIITP